MEALLTRCPWYIGGPALAALVIGLQWASNSRLGMTGTFGQVLDLVRERSKSKVDWRVFLFVGVLLGALLFAGLGGSVGGPTFAHGAFDARFTNSLPLKALLLAGAGVLIGFGSRMAGGCTSGAGLCGVPRLSKGSIATTGTFVLVAMVTAQVIVRLFPAGAP